MGLGLRTERLEIIGEVEEAATGEILAYYNLNFNTILVVDASPIGLGVILMQVNPIDEDDIRIIAYASRSLSEV